MPFYPISDAKVEILRMKDSPTTQNPWKKKLTDKEFIVLSLLDSIYAVFLNNCNYKSCQNRLTSALAIYPPVLKECYQVLYHCGQHWYPIEFKQHRITN